MSANAKTQMNQHEAREIVQWLCPLPSDGAYASLENALHRRLPGTGKWFLQSEEFTNWIKSKSSTIWITGLRKPFYSIKLLCCADSF